MNNKQDKQPLNNRLDQLKALLKTENGEELTVSFTKDQVDKITDDFQKSNEPSAIQHIAAELTPRQAQFLQLYYASNFKITEVCEDMGINRGTYYEWMNNSPAFKEAIESWENQVVEKSIDCLYKAIENGDTKSAQFMLKHLHKKFKDRIDITSNGQTMGSVIQIIMPKDDDNV